MNARSNTGFTSRRFILCAAYVFSFISVVSGSEVEPIKIDLQDDYYVGESLQVRLIVPERLEIAFLLLRGPDGKVESLLPNAFESFTSEEPFSRRRLFPNPSLGYQGVVESPGDYRLMTVHIGALTNDPLWPTSAPSDLVGIVRSLNRSIREAGSNEEPAISSLLFSVNAGKRSQLETLPLINGVLDGPKSPAFASGETRLATSKDYRILWLWAKLINSPAHRHQSFLIECHATENSTRKENLELSQMRADSILTYLVEECQVPRERLTATGKGDFERLGEIETDDPRQNRVTIVLDNAAGARILR